MSSNKPRNGPRTKLVEFSNLPTVIRQVCEQTSGRVRVRTEIGQ